MILNRFALGVLPGFVVLATHPEMVSRRGPFFCNKEPMSKSIDWGAIKIRPLTAALWLILASTIYAVAVFLDSFQSVTS